jgi:hypothetical protein
LLAGLAHFSLFYVSRCRCWNLRPLLLLLLLLLLRWLVARRSCVTARPSSNAPATTVVQAVYRRAVLEREPNSELQSGDLEPWLQRKKALLCLNGGSL